jgi:Domain of unknown function (DUF222)/HNH endonuclease
MDPNTHSTELPASPSAGESAGRADGLAALAAELAGLAAQNLTGLTDAVAAERVLQLRRLLDRLEGHWLAELAAVDARGAAGADQGVQAASTAGWLRHRLRLGGGAATSAVRTARAVFRGPLTQTATALTDGVISPAHASVVAAGTQDLPAHIAVEAEPVLVAAARRLDPPRLRRVLGHLRLVADPDGAQATADRQHQRRGLWLTPTFEGMVAVDGLLEPEAGQSVLAALEPLARPADAHDERSGGQRRADALAELARRALEGGKLPQSGGVRPQLSVLVDLDSLQGRRGAVGGEIGAVGPLHPEACRRLACGGAVTRVLVTRQPTHHSDGGHLPHGLATKDPAGHHSGGHHHAGGGDHSAGPDCFGGHDHPDDHDNPNRDPGGGPGLAQWLQAAMALLPPILGGTPSQPLDLGRTTRVVTPSQRLALAVRDGGCVFPGCDRPLAWTEAHHLVHWLDGGPTDLANLALLCRAHHRAVHEGGWRLVREPDGGLTAAPSHRRYHYRPHRRHHTAA